MSYATVADLRARLTQIPAGAANDALLQECLDEATALIDLELGFSFAAFGAAADKDVFTDHDDVYLRLSEYQAASITFIKRIYAKGTTSESLDTLTDWEELDDGRVYRYSGWQAGWYRVTAKWGADVAPTSVETICWEKARDKWYSKDGSASSNVAGVEGAGAVVVQRTWTDEQWRTLQKLRQEHGQVGFA